jgi:hypothetical protein
MPDGTTILDALLASHSPAEFARILGRNGKVVRDVLRGRFGVYVSRDARGHDAAWSEVLPYFAAYYTRDGDARAAVLAAWKAGEGVPDA